MPRPKLLQKRNLLSDMEKIDLGRDEKYSWSRAPLADIRSEGSSRRNLDAKLPALRDGDSLQSNGRKSVYVLDTHTWNKIIFTRKFPTYENFPEVTYNYQGDQVRVTKWKKQNKLTHTTLLFIYHNILRGCYQSPIALSAWNLQIVHVDGGQL